MSVESILAARSDRKKLYQWVFDKFKELNIPLPDTEHAVTQLREYGFTESEVYMAALLAARTRGWKADEK
jgi:hypothetical protein